MPRARDDMTTLVVSAGPRGVIAPLVATLDEPHVVSPLATPAWLQRVPGLAAYARRRSAPSSRATPLLAVDAGLRAWARDRTDRRYLADFAMRVAIDMWSARVVLRERPATIVASSLAARATFAAAKQVGARTILVLDLPLFRALHRDLDRAAAVWPERAFLRRFRAPSWAIARQEAERVLADLIIVRGAYARAQCVADGLPAARVAQLPSPPLVPATPPASPTNRLRLAGLAAARHGIDTALAVARTLGKTLVVRVGEGTEPADLARRAGIAADDGPVDAILCPAVCETYPVELRTLGIPVIASPMASLDGSGPDPFDIAAFTDAVARHATR